MQRKATKKRCSECKEAFSAWNTLQKVCGPRCAQKYAETQRRKAWRKEKTEFRKRTQTHGELTRIAQREFNRFIRLRDHDLPCISCDESSPGGDPRGGRWDCGHYRSVGSAPELRFEELNAARQCKRCNSYLGGNVVEYRMRLIKRIGAEKLAWIEGPHPPLNLTRDDLRDLAKKYRNEANKINKKIEGAQ